MELLDFLKENYPGIFIVLLIFREPIIKAIGAKFPALVSAWVADKEDKREHSQEVDTLTLQDKLAASEYERKQQAAREKEYWNIINKMVKFSQDVLTQKIDDSETNVLDMLGEIKEHLVKMSESFNGK